MFGKILKITRIWIIAALSTVAAAAAAAGEGAVSVAADSGGASAVIDSAKTRPDVNADTAKQDSAAARGENTPAVSQSADTAAAAASAVDTAEIDTSAITASSAANTASALLNGADTARINAGNDSLTLPDSGETEKMPLFADSKLFKWIAANIFYILFFGVSMLLVAATLYYFATRKDARRFLTTTRLSVLDKMVQRGCRYIESNYAGPDLSVDAVARELVTGPAYLDALFVKEIGIDVHDFIAQVRVNSIKNILSENPSINIEDACSRSGFKNKSDAERYFKRLCKMEIDEYVKGRRK